mgnify:CR=1 FL=1
MGKTVKRTVGYTEGKNFTCLEDLRQAGNFCTSDSISLDYCGKEKCKAGFSFGPYTRACYVIHFVVSGKGELRKNEKVYPIEAGQAFLIYPNEETVYQADQKDPWDYRWIGFHGYAAEEIAACCGFRKDNPVICVADMSQVDSDVTKIIESKEVTFVDEMKRMSSLYSILSVLGRSENGQPEEDSELEVESVYVRTAVNMIMNNYKQPIRLAQIAESIGISRGYLTTVFKKEMHTSPQDFLIRFRMEKAASLLSSTDYPVSVVAAEVGYADAFAFSKGFKLRYKMSPIEFRNQKKELVISGDKGGYTSIWPL